MKPYRIKYQWLEKGRVKRGHTVVTGRDEASCIRRFFKSHKHVWPVAKEVLR